MRIQVLARTANVLPGGQRAREDSLMRHSPDTREIIRTGSVSTHLLVHLPVLQAGKSAPRPVHQDHPRRLALALQDGVLRVIVVAQSDRCQD